MIQSIAKNLDVFLPIALVLIAFILKLFMDRNATTALALRSLYELPVDIFFLSISFVAAYTISSSSNINNGMAHFTLLFIIILLSVVAWRRSIKHFEVSKNGKALLFFIPNCAASIYFLVVAVKLIIGA